MDWGEGNQHIDQRLGQSWRRRMLIWMDCGWRGTDGHVMTRQIPQPLAIAIRETELHRELDNAGQIDLQRWTAQVFEARFLIRWLRRACKQLSLKWLGC